MRAEARGIAFSAPCLILAPARVVHGFAFEPETAGSVLTLSEPYLRDLVGRAPEFSALFAQPSAVPIPPGLRAQAVVEDCLEQLGREIAWTAPGHGAAVEALLMRLLVEVLRLSHHIHPDPVTGKGAQARLVARFRERVEEGYRTHAGIETYAAALSVTPKQLRSACLRVARASPLRIVQDRLVLEAKRMMLYSNMTVAEAGYELGFSDPAYFSRVFTRAVGVSPRLFRAGVSQ
jgi:AraC family transcriptional activator of pobA